MLPQEKRPAVARGLREAFGVTEFEDIRLLKDFAASQVFRIIVRGLPFLLKISARTSDPARHYACMRAAAEAGLSPRVWYTSAEDNVSIEDFVEARPFPAAEALVRVPAALRKLHALPRFPGVPHSLNTSCVFLIHQGPALDAFLQRFQAANVLGKQETGELFARYAQVAAVYPLQDGEMVSSHNDLFKPDNILFDGERVWLVDWEAAFRNDRYADLAAVANLLVSQEAEERVFLQEYFGETPDAYQLARFFLMRQIAHIFYAMVFLLMGSSGGPIDASEPVPEFGEFQGRFWAGEATLQERKAKAVYGRVHLERLFWHVQQAQFNEALSIVSARPASR